MSPVTASAPLAFAVPSMACLICADPSQSSLLTRVCRRSMSSSMSDSKESTTSAMDLRGVGVLVQRGEHRLIQYGCVLCTHALGELIRAFLAWRSLSTMSAPMVSNNLSESIGLVRKPFIPEALHYCIASAAILNTYAWWLAGSNKKDSEAIRATMEFATSEFRNTRK